MFADKEFQRCTHRESSINSSFMNVSHFDACKAAQLEFSSSLLMTFKLLSHTVLLIKNYLLHCCCFLRLSNHACITPFKSFLEVPPVVVAHNPQ